MELVRTFSALGDATRFAIVERLLKEGDLTAGQIGEDAELSAPAMSRHLKVLREVGILHQRVDKQRRVYSVRPQAVEAISAWTMSHRDFWQSSLDRLARALEEEVSKK